MVFDMIPMNSQLPDDVILSILLFLDGKDVRSFGNTCRRFRKLIIINKWKLRVPKLSWDTACLVFGRKIILSRSITSVCKRKRRQTLVANDSWEFTEEEFLRYFVNLFVVISPNVMYVKCKDFDENIARILKRCVGGLWGKTLALEMDKCSISESDLRRFFEHFSPFFLHLAGHFDRSIISDQVLPLSTLFSLFVGVNRADLRTCTRISGITVRKIVNNWFQRYSDISGVKSIENYETRNFCIEIPDCDLDYNEFFAFFRELTIIPHGTRERIRIYNLPGTLIDAISRNLHTIFHTFELWVQQGLCNDDDVKCSYTVFFKRGSDRTRVHIRFIKGSSDVVGRMLARGDIFGPSTLEGIDLLASVSVFDEELQQRKPLLDVSVSLFSTPFPVEMTIPEERIVDLRKKLKETTILGI